MRKFIWTISGVCAAAAGFLVWQRRTPPIAVLADHLQDAWKDNHTRA